MPFFRRMQSYGTCSRFSVGGPRVRRVLSVLPANAAMEYDIPIPTKGKWYRSPHILRFCVCRGLIPSNIFYDAISSTVEVSDGLLYLICVLPL